MTVHTCTPLYRRLHTKAHQCPGCTDLSQGLPTYIHKPKKLKLKKCVHTGLRRIIPSLPVFPLAMHTGLPMSSFFWPPMCFILPSVLTAVWLASCHGSGTSLQDSPRLHLPPYSFVLLSRRKAGSENFLWFTTVLILVPCLGTISQFTKLVAYFAEGGSLWVPWGTDGDIRGLNGGSCFFFMSCHFKWRLWKMGALPGIFPFSEFCFFCSFPFSKKILLNILNQACSATRVVSVLNILASSVEGWGGLYFPMLFISTQAERFTERLCWLERECPPWPLAFEYFVSSRWRGGDWAFWRKFYAGGLESS